MNILNNKLADAGMNGVTIVNYMGISANFAQIVLSVLIVVILTVLQIARNHPSVTTGQVTIQLIPTYAQRILLKDQKAKNILKMSTI